MPIKNYLIFSLEQESYGDISFQLKYFSKSTYLAGCISLLCGAADPTMCTSVAITGLIKYFLDDAAAHTEQLSKDPPRYDIEQLISTPNEEHFLDAFESSGIPLTRDQRIGVSSSFVLAKGLGGILVTIERLQGIELMEGLPEREMLELPQSQRQLRRLEELCIVTIAAIDRLAPWLADQLLPPYFRDSTPQASHLYNLLTFDELGQGDEYHRDPFRVDEALRMLRDNLTALVGRIDDLGSPLPLMGT